MKTSKKTLLGFGLVLSLAVFLFSQTALALIPANNWRSATYTYTGQAQNNSPIRIVIKDENNLNITLNATFDGPGPPINNSDFQNAPTRQFMILESQNPNLLCDDGTLFVVASTITQNPATGYITGWVTESTQPPIEQCITNMSSVTPYGDKVSISNLNAPPAEGQPCTTNGEIRDGFTCVCVVEGEPPVEKCIWVGPAGPPNNGGGEDTSECVINSNIGLEWLLCPVTTAIGTAISGLDSFIQKQLNFDINQNLSDTGQVHTAWSIIKNVATALLVIVMLVMVIATALRG